MSTQSDEKPLYTPRTFNKVTRQRFVRDRWARLVRHTGSPSDVQKLLIGRIIGIEWEIARLAARRDAGEGGDRSAREFLALHNHLRLLSRELGLKPAPERAPSLAEILAADAETSADENKATEPVIAAEQEDVAPAACPRASEIAGGDGSGLAHAIAADDSGAETAAA